MALFPKIQSPCPYKGDLAAIMDGDVCRLCKRQVFDLTAMSDGERVDFFDACSGEEVCVSYRLPTIAAAVLAVAAVTAPMAAAACESTDTVEIVMGGVKDTKNVQFVETRADRALPMLPVVYDDAPAAPVKTAHTTEPAKGPAGT
ncbi:MAG TPA: hypothetical protein VHL34_15850 [Rhizomicrobium sp.]|nr:hypothetical protein [Rhizomicrobium sp.]